MEVQYELQEKEKNRIIFVKVFAFAVQIFLDLIYSQFKTSAGI